MSRGITESNRLIVNKYRLPDKFLSLKLSSGILLSQLKMFEQAGLLWLLQRGFGIKTLREPQEFKRKLSEIKSFVESVDASLRYFGISSAAQRKDIIYKRIDTPGRRMEFARDLEMIASFYKISGLEFRDEDRKGLFSDINTSSRKHPFRLALGRLVRRLSIEDPEKMDAFYDSLGLPPQRRKALSMLSDSRLVPVIIYMKEESFNGRFRAYHEGIDIVFTGNAGERKQERFSFTDKAGMFDVVMGFPLETIRCRIIDMRKKGLVSIPATRLKGILPHNPPDLARNHCAAARQAILRDDLSSARDYFRTAVTLAKDDTAILHDARKGLRYTELLMNAAAAATSQDISRAINIYEEAMVGIGTGQINRLHIHTAEKAVACVGSVESEAFSFELNRKIGYQGENALSRWGKNLLAGEVMELSSSGLKGTLGLANDLAPNLPPLEEVEPHLKLAIITRALKIAESSCDEEQKKSFPVIFALHGLFKRSFRFDAYPGAAEKAREIIDIFHENGILDFDSSSIPDRIARFALMRLCFHICLFVAANVPPTSGRISRHENVDDLLGYLSEKRYDELRYNLHKMILMDLLMNRGIISMPAYLPERLTYPAILRRVLLYENAGIPFKSNYWWQLNTSETAIVEHHIPLEQKRKEKNDFIAEHLPGSPGYVPDRMGIRKLNEALAIVDEYGLRFLVESGHLFSYIIRNPGEMRELFGKIQKKVDIARKILALYGFSGNESDDIIASSFSELSWNKLVTLNEMFMIYSSAGLDPQRAAIRILSLFKQRYPRAIFHFDKAISNKTATDISIAVTEEPPISPLTTDLKQLENDLTEFWRIETNRMPALSEEDQSSLIRLAKGGDIAARNRVVKANLKIIPSIIKNISIGRRGYKLYEKHPAYLDAIQVGNIALIEAIDSYPGTGDFMEHLTACVKEAIEKEMPKLRLSYGFTERTKLLLGIDTK